MVDPAARSQWTVEDAADGCRAGPAGRRRTSAARRRRAHRRPGEAHRRADGGQERPWPCRAPRQDGGDPKALAQALKDQHALLERLTAELQHSVLAMRVLPLRQVFQRFPRLVGRWPRASARPRGLSPKARHRGRQGDGRSPVRAVAARAAQRRRPRGRAAPSARRRRQARNGHDPSARTPRGRARDHRSRGRRPRHRSRRVRQVARSGAWRARRRWRP